MNSFTATTTSNAFTLANGGVVGDTRGVVSASTANITNVIPPYYALNFIIYTGRA